MDHRSNEVLFEYWNTVRNGRFAPHRYEIEPVRISSLLPDVFILECAGPSDYRFRLAGTRMCEQMGHEMRGCGLLDYWREQDREALHSLLHTIVNDGAAAAIRFEHSYGDRGTARFEMLLLPLIQAGSSVNRILGCIGALEEPYWLGTVELRQHEITSFELIWPDGKPWFLQNAREPAALDQSTPQVAGDGRRRFRVFEGGLAERPE